MLAVFIATVIIIDIHSRGLYCFFETEYCMEFILREIVAENVFYEIFSCTFRELSFLLFSSLPKCFGL